MRPLVLIRVIVLFFVLFNSIVVRVFIAVIIDVGIFDGVVPVVVRVPIEVVPVIVHPVELSTINRDLIFNLGNDIHNDLPCRFFVSISTYTSKYLHGKYYEKEEHFADMIALESVAQD